MYLIFVQRSCPLCRCAMERWMARSATRGLPILFISQNLGSQNFAEFWEPKVWGIPYHVWFEQLPSMVLLMLPGAACSTLRAQQRHYLQRRSWQRGDNIQFLPTWPKCSVPKPGTKLWLYVHVQCNIRLGNNIWPIELLIVWGVHRSDPVGTLEYWCYSTVSSGGTFCWMRQCWYCLEALSLFKLCVIAAWNIYNI